MYVVYLNGWALPRKIFENFLKIDFPEQIW